MDSLQALDEALGVEFGRRALDWVGTPYVSAARERGLGSDCVGVVLGVAWSLGLTDFDDRDYSPGAGAPRIVAGLARFCREVTSEPLRPGDLVLFRLLGVDRHIGVLAPDLSLVHAEQKAGRVVRHGFQGSQWERLVVSRHRWRLDGPEAVERARAALAASERPSRPCLEGSLEAWRP